MRDGDPMMRATDYNVHETNLESVNQPFFFYIISLKFSTDSTSTFLRLHSQDNPHSSVWVKLCMSDLFLLRGKSAFAQYCPLHRI